MELTDVRRDCETLERELAGEYYRAGAGLQETQDTASILARYPHLAERAAFDAATTAWQDTPDGPERYRLSLLRDHLAGLYTAARLAVLGDALHNEEAAATVELDGETVPYPGLLARILAERDHDTRRRWAAARDDALRRFEPRYRELHQAAAALDGELGFADTVDRCQQLGGLPLDALAGVAERVLSETAALYRRCLDPALAAFGLSPQTAQWCDLARLFRVTGYDAWFAAGAMVPRLTAMVTDLGLDPLADGHIRYDLDERPLKSTRPFCSVQQAPEQVVLVLRPMGGLGDWAAFLHELGHSLHYGYVDAALPWEFRHLGDNSITECFAFLFDRLTVDTDWLRQVPGVPDPEPLAATLALRELMMLRKYAAQLLYELDLYRAAQPEPLADDYARRLSAATGVAYSSAAYLASVDPLFYCARYFQGWLLEAVLAEALGPAWWSAPATGPRLRELFARGQDQPAGALFAALGTEPLAIAPYLRRAARELGPLR